MSSEKLTRLQQDVFDFICHYSSEEGFPPSYAEIAQNFKFSSDGTVRTYLEHLEKKGYIKRLGSARGIQILKPPLFTYIPIVGSIAAGSPILAVEEIEGTLNDIQELKHIEGRIALRIKGESMIEAGIFDGDIAIIQTGVPLQNGQIGAIMVNDEVTLKRIFFETQKEQVRLQPENARYTPIYLTRKDFDAKVVGKYIALVRQA